MEKIYELWFRDIYKNSLKDKKTTMAIRPGDRRYPNPKGAKEGELARIRVLSKPGNEEKGIMPEFDSFESLVRINKIKVYRLGDLKDSELQNCLPNCQDKEKIKIELAMIYGKEFSNNDIISIIYFEYINDGEIV